MTRDHFKQSMYSPSFISHEFDKTKAYKVAIKAESIFSIIWHHTLGRLYTRNCPVCRAAANGGADNK